MRLLHLSNVTFELDSQVIVKDVPLFLYASFIGGGSSAFGSLALEVLCGSYLSRSHSLCRFPCFVNMRH